MAGNAAQFIRREAWGLAPDDPIVVGYGNAVAAMRARPEGDPTSWAYQAAIHGSEAVPAQPLWNQCQHRSWYFLPWHRMFLYRFEEIVRREVIATGGPADWALPYWNYGLGGRNASLPPAFREPRLPDGSENPLYVAERAPTINAGGALPPAATSPAKALGRPNFTGRAEFGGGESGPAQFAKAGGTLEETPHNVVHEKVGGEAGLMANILAAAQDPIFWLHHANIDRLWSAWASMAGHSNPSSTAWLDQGFELFDTAGQRVSMRCRDVLATTALGYVYDTEVTPPAAAPPPPPPAPAPAAARGPAVVEPEMVGASEERVVLVGAPVSVSIMIDGEAAREPIGGDRRVYVNVEDVEGERRPGRVYGVYANLPPEAPAELTPAHHIGNLSFFGLERASAPVADEPAHALGASYEITSLARELEAHGEWVDHPLVVGFRPLSLLPHERSEPAARDGGPRGEHAPVRIGRVSVFYDA
jgi:tyrosinase